ncbi:large conductance mechanosensitive channel protein MscL [Solirubrobacter soli]|uniref:large conductance mechanosensitive channel protein MscL n=1 Tax=Solirubrobacter soli TaxID=363832 RepID=UPI0004097C18|nr:large conductance mechanosensitive channel protein MscL [Solirubrobacter soli]
MLVANRTSMIKEFREFILRGNVVDLAVAVVIGAAFGALIKSIVDNIFTPLIAAIIGKPSFGDLTFTIHHGVFRYGLVINDLITFLSIAAVIFFAVVKPLNMLAERRKHGEVPEPEAQPEDIILLTDIRDLLAKRPA